jgi:hypothetical protein
VLGALLCELYSSVPRSFFSVQGSVHFSVCTAQCPKVINNFISSVLGAHSTEFNDQFYAPVRDVTVFFPGWGGGGGYACFTI